MGGTGGLRFVSHPSNSLDAILMLRDDDRSIVASFNFEILVPGDIGSKQR
jgi:hypothetical protein